MNVLYNSEKLQGRASDILSSEKIRFAGLAEKLSALNPLGIISRGYSAVTNEKGDVIRSVSEIAEGDRINVRFSDGYALADVIKTER